MFQNMSHKTGDICWNGETVNRYSKHTILGPTLEKLALYQIPFSKSTQAEWSTYLCNIDPMVDPYSNPQLSGTKKLPPLLTSCNPLSTWRRGNCTGWSPCQLGWLVLKHGTWSGAPKPIIWEVGHRPESRPEGRLHARAETCVPPCHLRGPGPSDVTVPSHGRLRTATGLNGSPWGEFSQGAIYCVFVPWTGPILSGRTIVRTCC